MRAYLTLMSVATGDGMAQVCQKTTSEIHKVVDTLYTFTLVLI